MFPGSNRQVDFMALRGFLTLHHLLSSHCPKGTSPSPSAATGSKEFVSFVALAYP